LIHLQLFLDTASVFVTETKTLSVLAGVFRHTFQHRRMFLDNQKAILMSNLNFLTSCGKIKYDFIRCVTSLWHVAEFNRHLTATQRLDGSGGRRTAGKVGLTTEKKNKTKY